VSLALRCSRDLAYVVHGKQVGQKQGVVDEIFVFY